MRELEEEGLARGMSGDTHRRVRDLLLVDRSRGETVLRESGRGADCVDGTRALVLFSLEGARTGRRLNGRNGEVQRVHSEVADRAADRVRVNEAVIGSVKHVERLRGRGAGALVSYNPGTGSRCHAKFPSPSPPPFLPPLSNAPKGASSAVADSIDVVVGDGFLRGCVLDTVEDESVRAEAHVRAVKQRNRCQQLRGRASDHEWTRQEGTDAQRWCNMGHHSDVRKGNAARP